MSIHTAQFKPKHAISDTHSDPSPKRLERIPRNGPQSAKNDANSRFFAHTRFGKSCDADSDGSDSVFRRTDQESEEEEDKMGSRVMITDENVDQEYDQIDKDQDDLIARSRSDPQWFLNIRHTRPGTID